MVHADRRYPRLCVFKKRTPRQRAPLCVVSRETRPKRDLVNPQKKRTFPERDAGFAKVYLDPHLLDVGGGVLGSALCVGVVLGLAHEAQALAVFGDALHRALALALDLRTNSQVSIRDFVLSYVTTGAFQVPDSGTRSREFQRTRRRVYGRLSRNPPYLSAQTARLPKKTVSPNTKL